MTTIKLPSQLQWSPWRKAAGYTEGPCDLDSQVMDGEKSRPGMITFPYSRHSSYEELCHLLSIFRPKDVWPCTVNRMDWLENGNNLLCILSLPPLS